MEMFVFNTQLEKKRRNRMPEVWRRGKEWKWEQIHHFNRIDNLINGNTLYRFGIGHFLEIWPNDRYAIWIAADSPSFSLFTSPFSSPFFLLPTFAYNLQNRNGNAFASENERIEYIACYTILSKYIHMKKKMVIKL